MTVNANESHVGFSIFDSSEDCWEYNENACFIASTESAAMEFLKAGSTPAGACRIQAVSFEDVLRDFGYSSGEYAMELEAFQRFEQRAEASNVRFEAEPYDGDESLIVVELDVAPHDDE